MATTKLPDLTSTNSFSGSDLLLVRKNGSSVDQKIKADDLVKSLGNTAVNGFYVDTATNGNFLNNAVISLVPSNSAIVTSFVSGMRVSFLCRSSVTTHDTKYITLSINNQKANLIKLDNDKILSLKNNEYVECVYFGGNFIRTNDITTLAPIPAKSVVVSDTAGNITTINSNIDNGVVINKANAISKIDLIKDENINAEGISKIKQKSISDTHIVDAGISKLAAKSVKADQIDLLAVDVTKISSQGAAVGTFLRSGIGGASSYSPLPTTGQILQIVNFELDVFATCTAVAGALRSFDTPFAIKITPKSNTSKIIIAVTASAGLINNGYGFLTLCKNGNPLKTGNFNSTHGKHTFSAFYPGSTGSYKMFSFSGFFYDSNLSVNQITYEMKASSNITGYTVLLNGMPGNSDAATISTLIAVEVQI